MRLGRTLPLCFLAALLTALAGCGNDIEAVRRLQSRQHARERQQSQVDHLGEALSFVSRLAELDLDSATQQVIKHLNAWYHSHSDAVAAADRWQATPLLSGWSDRLPPEVTRQAVTVDYFQPDDLWHLRQNYLLGRVADWAAVDPPLDPLLEDWFAQQAERMPDPQLHGLQIASRLFDWTVRNVRLEPLQPTDPAPQPTAMPAGLQFRGPGYRQTTLGALWYGTGDALQRSGVFLQLCRHVGLDACLLAVPAADGDRPQEWLAAVLIGDQLYLFDAALGLAVPGPGEQGIATLAQAREDASILRRMNVAGAFDYPFQQQDIQQCVALLDASPELLSRRMHDLQGALTGTRRMSVYLDADAAARRLAAIDGVSDVRLWDRAIQAQRYQEAIRRLVNDDPRIGIWFFNRRGMMSDGAIVPAPKPQKSIVRADSGDPQQGEEVFKVEEGKMTAGAIAGNTPWILVNARWQHLEGQFDSVDNVDGARPLYMELRRPEYEIADLGIDVQLQQQYGIRRQPGMAAETYDLLVQRIQHFSRQAKQNATYWLSLIHMDQARWDTADNWLQKRVLENPHAATWETAARYNLGRTLEHLGQEDQAIELYKTSGDPQEHGNRLRARLLSQEEESSPPSPSPPSPSSPPSPPIAPRS